MKRFQALKPSTTVTRIFKYSLFRGASLLIAVAASLYLAVMIANLGGFLDTILKAEITGTVNGMLIEGWLKNEPQDVRKIKIAERVWAMEEAYGLHQPFYGRAFEWWKRSITLDWGAARRPYIQYKVVQGSDIASNDIPTLIFTYLPRTLLLLGTSNLILFLICILVALQLVRRPHPLFEGLLLAFSPLSSIPPWMYGIFAFAFCYKVLGWWSLRTEFINWPKNFTLHDLGSLAQFLALPILSILISKVFQGILIWRTYLNVFAGENYMELARAKGLPYAVIERQYLVRPSLPGFLTSFSLIIISIWQECIALEHFFNLQGLGAFFMQALNGSDVQVVVAIISLFAYILAFTVFLLDIAYALIDPRVKLDFDRVSENPARMRLPRKKNLTKAGAARPARFVAPALSLKDAGDGLRQALAAWRIFFAELSRHRSAVAGLLFILVLSVISILTVILIPYDRAISIWRGDNKVWLHNPILVPPAWTNWFRKDPLPENIILSSQSNPEYKTVVEETAATTRKSIIIPFQYAYSQYPQDVVVLFTPKFRQKQPFITMTWVTPEGREIPINGMAVGYDATMYFSRNKSLAARLKTKFPIVEMFSKAGALPGEALKGDYELRIDALLFEKDGDIDAEMTVYGKVYGLAGTDSDRRDLSLVLLWGTAVALSFGIIAAFGTVFSSMLLAAVSAWHGGWIDSLIQRLTEINMILPALPISIMIFMLYSKSFWIIVGVTVALSIFGSAIKNYRAVYLQIKELPYIEAARAYGASSSRIIFQYLIPKIRAMMIPQFIVLVPGYVFYESTLAFLGVSDPWLPTLGKLFVSHMANGVFNDPAYLYLQPVGILVLIGLSFALFGFALERIFNEQNG